MLSKNFCSFNGDLFTRSNNLRDSVNAIICSNSFPIWIHLLSLCHW